MIRSVVGKRAAAALVAGCVLGGIIAVPSEASAWWVRQHSADCVDNAANGSGIRMVVGSNQNNGGEVSGIARLVCAVPDTSSTRKVDIVTANVEVNVINFTVRARPCNADWDGSLGQCGNVVSAGNPGHRTMALGDGGGIWDSSAGGDFGFISIESDGGSARVAGIFYSN